MHDEAIRALARRARMEPEHRWVLEQLPRAGGVGITPPEAVREAAIALSVMRALIDAGSPCWGAAWELATAPPPGSLFYVALDVLRGGAACEVDVARRRVARGGAAVTSVPRSLTAAVDAWAGAAGPTRVERPEDGGAASVEEGVIAALLTADYVPVPLLSDEQVVLGLCFLSGVPEPGTGSGRRCPHCGKDAGPRHYRECWYSRVRPSVAHDKLGGGIISAFRGGEGVRVRGPRNLAAPGEDRVLDDVAVAVEGEQSSVDVKTHNMHAAGRIRGTKDFGDLVAEDRELMRTKYAPTGASVSVLGISLDGLVEVVSCGVVARLEELHVAAGLRGVQPSVAASMGAALLRQQTKQWLRWAAGHVVHTVSSATGRRAALARRAGALPVAE